MLSMAAMMVAALSNCGGSRSWNWQATGNGDGLAPGSVADNQVGLETTRHAAFAQL
jgi:hypothetical protein